MTELLDSVDGIESKALPKIFSNHPAAIFEFIFFRAMLQAANKSGGRYEV